AIENAPARHRERDSLLPELSPEAFAGTDDEPPLGDTKARRSGINQVATLHHVEERHGKSDPRAAIEEVSLRSLEDLDVEACRGGLDRGGGSANRASDDRDRSLHSAGIACEGRA